MRIKDIFPLVAMQLNEFSMAPGYLRAMASKINADAGMEFEMIVPGIDIRGDEGDYDLEQDYDDNPRPDSIDEIINFFDQGGMNSRRELQRLRTELSDELREANEAYKNDEWDAEKRDIIERYIHAENPQDTEEELAEKLEAAMVRDNSDARDAYDDWSDNWDHEIDEAEWLNEQGINEMSDVVSEYSVEWPYYSRPESNSIGDIENIAYEFGKMIGRPVNTGTEHGGGEREPNTYVIEPDPSIEPRDSHEGGLEFVSPPLPFKEMLLDLVKIKAWADKMGCKTNESTGLHINVSIPGYSRQKLDFVKLALLLGDEYISSEFERTGNIYAKSAMEIIKTKVRDNPADVEAVLLKMKEHLDGLASTAIHSGNTSKHTSINTKEGWIEFRAPGDDWLGKHYNKIEPTLLRFVVALDAAIDPNKHRQEYLKKLYKLLGPKNTNDPIGLFARYAAGELSAGGLKTLVKNMQQNRNMTKMNQQQNLTGIAPAGATGQLAMYRVISIGGAQKVVQARSEDEAKEIAKQENPSDFATGSRAYFLNTINSGWVTN